MSETSPLKHSLQENTRDMFAQFNKARMRTFTNELYENQCSKI